MAGAKQKCEKKFWSVTVHAQGEDCGKKGPPPQRTISSGPTTADVPITVAQGLQRSEATFALLKGERKSIREGPKAKMHKWISERPPGGAYGQKPFDCADRTGGKRYDIDIRGNGGNSFLT